MQKGSLYHMYLSCAYRLATHPCVYLGQQKRKRGATMEKTRAGRIQSQTNIEEIRAGYCSRLIEYMVRLLSRMDLESLERLMDQIIDEI